MIVHTPQGIREATPEELAKIEAMNPKTALKADLSKAVSLQQEIDAIKKYLGVL